MNTIAKEEQRAAFALIESDGKMLTVFNPSFAAFGLPGGTIERGERPSETCKRELLEEIGVVPTSLLPIYTGLSMRDGELDVSKAWYLYVYRAIIHGMPASMESGCPILWMRREEFLAQSPYRQFYEMLFNLER